MRPGTFKPGRVMGARVIQNQETVLRKGLNGLNNMTQSLKSNNRTEVR